MVARLTSHCIIGVCVVCLLAIRLFHYRVLYLPSLALHAFLFSTIYHLDVQSWFLGHD